MRVSYRAKNEEYLPIPVHGLLRTLLVVKEIRSPLFRPQGVALHYTLLRKAILDFLFAPFFFPLQFLNLGSDLPLLATDSVTRYREAK